MTFIQRQTRPVFPGTTSQSTTGPSFMEYPPGMKVGQRFPDTDMPYQVMMYGAPIDWIDKITSRKVAGQETVTTPAGSWSALKQLMTLPLF